MPLVETQALVLETREYRETSMLATLLTPDRGRLGAVAKGARRGKSSLASILQPFSLLHVRLAVREPAAGLANLVSADLIERPAYARVGARGDALARLAYAGLYAEVLASTDENDPHSAELFALAQGLFSGLSEARHPGSFAVHGAFALLESLGYAPHLEPDEDEGADRPKGRWVFDLLGGTLRKGSGAVSDARNLYPLSAEAVRVLRRTMGCLRENPIPSPATCPIVNRRVGPVLLRLAVRMLEVQLERRLRSARYLEEMVLRPA
ncbi:DNA repair protein RecO [Candidatus Sumerlaeota bacterium]|nr:DNA repair protein RecO [Candidatus Sumerlaeota bacterium]